MGYSFDDLGIGRAEVLGALDLVADGGEKLGAPARSVYLMDPRDQLLWDLHITLRAIAQLTGKKIAPEERGNYHLDAFNSLGFSYVIFDEQKVRELGIRGHLPVAIEDEHVLYSPEKDGVRNGLLNPLSARVRDVAQLNAADAFRVSYEHAIARMHFGIERRTADARQVKQARGLTCEGCGLDGEAAFGRDLAMSAMEAHHLVPVADMPEGGREVSTDDFAVLCATCHRLIHRLQSPDDLDGLRKLMRGKGPGKGLPWLR